MSEARMKVINNWHDLEPYGIKALTGEACALSMRLLCDVNRSGLNLMERALGGVSITPNPDWNGHDAIGSLLIPYDMFESIAVIALTTRNGFNTVAALNRGCIGFNRQEVLAEIKALEWCPLKKECEDWIEAFLIKSGRPDVKRWYTLDVNPDPKITIDDRNVHQMSGRVR